MAERLLVIDDEPNMLRLLKTILMDKTGYTVITTNILLYQVAVKKVILAL